MFSRVVINIYCRVRVSSRLLGWVAVTFIGIGLEYRCLFLVFEEFGGCFFVIFCGRSFFLIKGWIVSRSDVLLF